MRSGAQRGLNAVGCLVLVVLVAWLVLAHIVFAIRHPWATDTERLIHFFDAMQFKQIPYDEMRRRKP